jgi:hypothetical protein
MNMRKRILLGFLLVAAVCSCGRQEYVEEFKARWIRLRHAPVREARVGTDALIVAEVEAYPDDKNVNVFVYFKTDGDTQEVVKLQPLEAGKYFGAIPTQARGTSVEYYVEARAGSDLVVRVPNELESPGFVFYFKGTPGRALLASHITMIFLSLLVFGIVGYLSFKALKDRRRLVHIPRIAFLGAILFFVAAFPLGMIVGYQTYGKLWTGFPLGTDVTDDTSLAIVLYWAAAAFFYRGSTFKKDPHGDLLSIRTLPYVYMVGVILTVALLLIPH